MSNLSCASMPLRTVYFPAGLGRFFANGLGELLDWQKLWTHAATASGIAVWAASTAYGVFFGRSENTSKWIPDASAKEKLLHYLAKVTPYVFVLGLLPARRQRDACSGYGIPTSELSLLAVLAIVKGRGLDR